MLIAHFSELPVEFVHHTMAEIRLLTPLQGETRGGKFPQTFTPLSLHFPRVTGLMQLTVAHQDIALAYHVLV